MCHTCQPRPRATTRTSLPHNYFEYYEADQLALEYELEEMGTTTLQQCTRDCRARQVHASRDVHVIDADTGKQEWNYVTARCAVCGRAAGRSAALVNIERT
jgi:hypothetical protein